MTEPQSSGARLSEFDQTHLRQVGQGREKQAAPVLSTSFIATRARSEQCLKTGAQQRTYLQRPSLTVLLSDKDSPTYIGALG